MKGSGQEGREQKRRGRGGEGKAEEGRGRKEDKGSKNYQGEEISQ